MTYNYRSCIDTATYTLETVQAAEQCSALTHNANANNARRSMILFTHWSTNWTKPDLIIGYSWVRQDVCLKGFLGVDLDLVWLSNIWSTMGDLLTVDGTLFFECPVGNDSGQALTAWRSAVISLLLFQLKEDLWLRLDICELEVRDLWLY